MLLGFVGVLVLMFGVFLVLLSAISSDTDCSTVALPTAARFAALDPDDQRVLVGQLNGCARYEGRTAGQIAAALGPPAQDGRDDDGRRVLRYEVGAEPGEDGLAGVDPDVLLLTLDDVGRVVDATVRQDSSSPP